MPLQMRLLPPNSDEGWTSYAWLVYLIFFVIYPAFGHASGREWAYTALGICMLFARYWLAIPVLALAGALAAAKRVPPSSGTLPTHTLLFVIVLIGTVITVGALTFVPALALGPVVEHLLLFAGQ